MLRRSGSIARLSQSGPRAGLFFACLLVAGGALAAGPRMFVVRSANLSAYAQVVAGFSAEVQGDVSDVTLDDNPEHQRAVFARIAAAAPDLVLAVGPSAAVAAKRTLPKTPVIFCMVPYFERYGLEGAKVTGIALTSDLGVEFAAFARLFPQVKRVGILHDPRYSSAVIAQAQAAARGGGISVVPLAIEDGTDARRALDRAKGRVDALLLVADKTVASGEIVRRELGFGRDARVPIIGFAPTQVREGATLAFAPSYLAIGQQAGRLANKVVVEKVDPGTIAITQPEVLEITFNLTSAHNLSSSGQVDAAVLGFAAQRDFPVRVYK